MLSGDFYTLIYMNAGSPTLDGDLEINPAHPIFKGHFPGQPVVPGVCMIQIIQEILEKANKRKLQLARSEYAKFLAVIDPRIHSKISFKVIQAEISNDELSVSAILFYENLTFFKIKAVFSLPPAAKDSL
jgi:3-hydroxyacyl-[acyl-carrier-protein] dehydratase